MLETNTEFCVEGMVEEKDMLKFVIFASSAHCIRFICKNKYLLLLMFAELFILRLESPFLEDIYIEGIDI